MPTDDERRAVARRLRRSRSEWSGMGWRLWLGPKFCAVVLSDGNRDELEDAAHRLADLIEPQPERTCEVESSHEHESDGCYSWFEYELSCGHQVKSDCQLPPNYCPECGKKVEYNARNYI